MWAGGIQQQSNEMTAQLEYLYVLLEYEMFKIHCCRRCTDECSCKDKLSALNQGCTADDFLK